VPRDAARALALGSTRRLPGFARCCSWNLRGVIPRSKGSDTEILGRQRKGSLRFLGLVLNLYAHNSNFGFPYILYRVRWKGRRPMSGWGRGLGLGWRGPCVQENSPFRIAPDKIACAQEVEHARPAMSVYGRRSANWNPHIENADAFVLEQ
jgi:hypothetical protein